MGEVVDMHKNGAEKSVIINTVDNESNKGVTKPTYEELTVMVDQLSNQLQMYRQKIQSMTEEQSLQSTMINLSFLDKRASYLFKIIEHRDAFSVKLNLEGLPLKDASVFDNAVYEITKVLFESSKIENERDEKSN